MIRGKILKVNPAQDFNDDHPCVFILSTGRAGTETLAHLFHLAGNVFSYHEPSPKLYALSKIAYEKKQIYSADKHLKDTLAEGFLTSRRDLLDYSLFCNRGYVETSPQVTFLAPIILDSIPNAKFIHLVRDPHEVVHSGMRRNWFNNNIYDKNRIIPIQGTEHAKIWDSLNPLNKNLWLWAETNRWILKFASNLNERNFLRVHSENIFNYDMRVIAQLFRFISSKLPSEKRVNNILKKKYNKQRYGDFNDPENWLDCLDDSIKKLVQSTSIALDYEIK